jgi:hypothetical protein
MASLSLSHILKYKYAILGRNSNSAMSASPCTIKNTMGDGNGTTQMGNITNSVKVGDNSTSLGNNSSFHSSQTKSRTYVATTLFFFFFKFIFPFKGTCNKSKIILVGIKIVNYSILLFGNSIQESEFTPLLQRIQQIASTTIADTKQVNL